MSDPVFILNKKILDNVAMTADRASEVVDMCNVSGFAMHAIWTGAPEGDVVVSGSNDGINFVPVNTQATAGAAGQHLLNVERQHYRYLRVNFVFTSGSGSLTVYLSGKTN